MHGRAWAIATTLLCAPLSAHAQLVRFEEPLSSSAEQAGSCVGAPEPVRYLFRFGIRNPEGPSAADARTRVNEQFVFDNGNPRVLVIGQRTEDGQRTCTIRPPSAGDLRAKGPQTPVLMEQDGKVVAWAIRSLGKGLRPDTYVFLVAGPAVLPKP